MKKINSFLLFVFIMSLFASEASSQKIMQLNDSLKMNSDRLDVKTRGGTGFKYDFGIYKTIFSKQGSITTKTRSKLFSGREESESRQKSAIEISANEKDTATINIVLNIKGETMRELGIFFSQGRVEVGREEYPSTNKQENNIYASISTSTDTSVWDFVYVNVFDMTKLFGWIEANGFLSDGKRNIEIKNVSKWDDGKSAAFRSKIGFEFFMDGSIVAALQNPVNTIQKKYVWLKKDLDDNMKLVLAAAATILLTYSNEMPE